MCCHVYACNICLLIGYSIMTVWKLRSTHFLTLSAHSSFLSAGGQLIVRQWRALFHQLRFEFPLAESNIPLAEKLSFCLRKLGPPLAHLEGGILVKDHQNYVCMRVALCQANQPSFGFCLYLHRKNRAIWKAHDNIIIPAHALLLVSYTWCLWRSRAGLLCTHMSISTSRKHGPGEWLT